MRRFLAIHGLDIMIRSACCNSVNGGFEYFAGEQGITLFSAATYGRETSLVTVDGTLTWTVVRFVLACCYFQQPHCNIYTTLFKSNSMLAKLAKRAPNHTGGVPNDMKPHTADKCTVSQALLPVSRSLESLLMQNLSPL